MHQRGGGIMFLRRNLCVRHSTEQFRWGALRLTKIFRYRTILWIIEGGYHVSPSKTFCHTVPENLVGEHFGYQKNSGNKIFYASERGGITFLRRKLFVTQYWKISLGSTSVIGKIRVSKNYMHQEGGGGGGGGWGYHVSPSKTFSPTVPKNLVGEHFGVSENFVYRKILCIRRGYH